MRQVFDNHMVAHVWAQQEQESGRSSNGNFYFRGTAIYSYRDGHLVGNFVDCPDGKPAVLLWSGNYSVTTSAHQSYAASAVRGQRCFHVPDLLASEHEANLAHLVFVVTDCIDEIKRAAASPTMNSRDYLFGHLPSLVATVREYCKAFRLKAPKVIRDFDLDTLRAEVARIETERRAKVEARNSKILERLGSQEAVAAYHERKRLLARAAALKGLRAYADYRKRERAVELLSDLREQVDANPGDATARAHLDRIDAFMAEHRAEAERREAEYAERERQRRLEYEATLARQAEFEALPSDEQEAQWRAGSAPPEWLSDEHRARLWRGGERVRPAYGPLALLRLKPGDPATVETSQGATFPAEHARLAWRALRAIYRRDGEWRANGQSIRLGHFTITRVDVDGTIMAGCHLVARQEAERFAVDVLGLEPVA